MKKILILLIIVLAQTTCIAQETTTMPVSNNNRYVLFMNPQFRSDQFVLDTQTGKIWQYSKTEDNSTVFQQVMYDCYIDNKTFSGRFTTPR